MVVLPAPEGAETIISLLFIFLNISQNCQYYLKRLATGDWRLATGDWRLAAGTCFTIFFPCRKANS
jgi:hypothetical protein